MIKVAERMTGKKLFWIWLPLLSLSTSVWAGGCRSSTPTVCPENVTVVVSLPDAGSDFAFDPDGGEAYTEPFDTPTGYAAPRCADACKNLQAKRCPEATTRKGEDSCYVVCARAEATGKIDFRTDCVARAASQAAIRACRTYRCGAR